MKKIKVKALEINDLTPTVKKLKIDLLGQDFSFLPGQWLDLFLQIAGKEYIGGYSITSPPEEKDFLELAIKYSERSKATKYLHQNLKPGDYVEICGGQGDFFYQEIPDTELVMIAGGIGITPLMSMIRHLVLKPLNFPLTLIYSNRKAKEITFKEELDQFVANQKNFRVLYTLTGEEENWQGSRGRINEEILKELIKDNNQYYLCGPAEMPDSLAKILLSLGTKKDSIHYEKWW